MKKQLKVNGFSAKEKKKAVVYGALFLCVLGGGCAAAVAYQKHAESAAADQAVQTASASLVSTGNDTIVYNDTSYVRKDNLQTYLFLGIDNDETIYEERGLDKGGQADVQMLVVVDPDENSWQILNIDRDSMVDVPKPDLFGRPAGYQYEQIALAHAYGNGLESSCENAELAVSHLLNDQEIDSYLALNMGAIKVVNEELGGLTVTVMDDFSAIDPQLKEGETVTLTDDQAVKYIRTRQGVGEETNEMRMARHESILAALQQKIPQMSDAEILNLYDAISDYMVTDFGSKDLVNLARSCAQMERKPTLTLEGQRIVVGENYGWQLDEDALQKTIVELFYTPEEG